jgi:lipoprotein-anchoring transpeptidase ErfK/SrfK
MLTRREFLKKSLIGAGAFAISPVVDWSALQQEWPDAEQLGRNCTGGWIELKSRPTDNSVTLNKVFEDSVVIWLQEVIGTPRSISRRWVETPEGYLYSPYLQPVRNQPNQPISTIPETGMGKGFWAEVSVPYVDIYPEHAPCSPWLQEVPKPRLYYSQVLWVDEMRTSENGQTSYRVNEKYGNCGDIYWADGKAFRPLTMDELQPIHPDAGDKRIIVDLNYQALSCYEGNDEVYFCRISSGGKFDYQGNPVDKYATPVGQHLPWRKSLSIHMAGGSTGAGWDTPGIAWTILFDPDGAAIHSTFWHNDFGVPRSHGCVNARPEDAKWIFRWAEPFVGYDPGDLQMQGSIGTIVDILAA